MLTEALKRDFLEIRKIAVKKGIACWISTENPRTYTFYYRIEKKPPIIKKFQNYSLTLGLNRLRREVKDYPVVD